MKTINASCYVEKIEARMPIVPVKVCSNTKSRYVYALMDSGSQETLISGELKDSLNSLFCLLFTIYCLLYTIY